MNINAELIGLSDIINCEVWQDRYPGKDTRFCTFTLVYEEPELCGDNDVLLEKTTAYLSYYVPETYDYFEDKEAIKTYLRGLDYYIESLQITLDDEDIKDTIQLRRLLFTIEKAG